MRSAAGVYKELAAGPFRDPSIGAVAGKVAVHNRGEALIPRMLHVRFILSFDFLRSAQSVFRTVFCCPGALAAYRASYPGIMELVDRTLPTYPRHAARRGQEMAEVEKTLAGLGLCPTVVPGVP